MPPRDLSIILARYGALVALGLLTACEGGRTLPDACSTDTPAPLDASVIDSIDSSTQDSATIDSSPVDAPRDVIHVIDAADAAPTAMVVVPSNGQLLPMTSAIVIRFSESMDPTSLLLGGELHAQSAAGAWSTYTNANDTFTLPPQTAWTPGPGRTLTIEARDLGGIALVPFAPSFDVAAGTLYYVSAAAPDDFGDGLSPATAKKTIQAAIAAATPPADVLVAEGSYWGESGTATQIALREGVSLYGGHNADFSAREPAMYVSTITDQATTGGTSSSANRVITAGAGVTAATAISGFDLVGGGGDYSSAVEINAGSSVTIHRNTISGGTGTSESCGIKVRGSGVITHNTIHGGSSVQTRGVGARGGSVEIADNRIDGGNASFMAMAIETLGNAEPVISSNTLYGGTSPRTVGIQIGGTANATIRNNEINAGGGTLGRYGIHAYRGVIQIDNNTLYAFDGNGAAAGIDTYSASTTVRIRNNLVVSRTCIQAERAAPTEVRNNNLSCEGVYAVRDLCEDSEYCTIAELELIAGIPEGASGNISLAPGLADLDGLDNDPSTMDDNDWRLTGASPVNVRGGGRVLTGVTHDRAGKPRTTNTPTGMTNAGAAGWSIGAHEHD